MREEELHMPPLRVALFTEIYRPAMNGVVASVETLAAALESRGHQCFLLRAQNGRRRTARSAACFASRRYRSPARRNAVPAHAAV